ncbi:nucleotidyltransferase domain-containing protein [Lacihabitans sp. CS3-21]|uniref:nucleotidyltransferase domain-containing protein n=1 Tax=Lacihabitans sp. CS3-21 TaxID=2487332 RepID=UPI0020CF8003|nr:nucleotidyltransferase domain-containing protein [Lacihabitans sp. CS3-21]MCP9748934.1 nucleotidyltransferase domain-containing protein [Lacihabitans sp. CS3-21]
MTSNIIKSIVLFGSAAKKENDINSDIDLCAIIDDKYNESDTTLLEIKNLTNNSEIIENTDSIAIYKESSLDKMLDYGSLFLWHLKLEGRVLYGDNYLHKKFNRLKNFNNHLREIEYIIDIFNNITESQNRIGNIPIFDISIYFTLLRNASILVSHKANLPRFGRIDCFLVTLNQIDGIPISLAVYESMLRDKLKYERGIENLKSSLKFNQNFKNDIYATLLKIKEYIEKQNSNNI